MGAFFGCFGSPKAILRLCCPHAVFLRLTGCDVFRLPESGISENRASAGKSRIFLLRYFSVMFFYRPQRYILKLCVTLRLNKNQELGIKDKKTSENSGLSI